jgi:pre-mRNA-splicing factor CDC5/CEF1
VFWPLTPAAYATLQYNADIPFNKQPAPGFYDTSAEKTRGYHAPVGELLSKLEKRKADTVEEEKRKKARKEREGKGKEGGDKNATFVAARNAQIQKLQEAEQIGNRRHLVLPEAQVGEQELEEIVKIGQAGERSRELVEGDDEASARLLGDYESLGRAKMARTPNTAPQRAFSS